MPRTASLEDCFSTRLGGNAVFVNNYNRRVAIRGCHIAKAGANGVAFVGDPKAVRSPLFEYEQRQSLNDIDSTPGPKTDNYPADCLRGRLPDSPHRPRREADGGRADCHVAGHHGAALLHLRRAPRRHQISDGCWGGHVIEFCDIFDTVKETGDHGSFNSWGRDRYWGLKDVDLNTVTAGENRELPLLDAVEPNVLRNNRWRCDHGWDIDLDDGSTNYRDRQQPCLNGGIKLREGFYRVVENNIMVGNSFHPHVWYGEQRGRLPAQHRGRRRTARSGVNRPWGKEVDYNLLHSPGKTNPEPAAALQKQSGRDEHSLEADALFVELRSGRLPRARGFSRAETRLREFPDGPVRGAVAPAESHRADPAAGRAGRCSTGHFAIGTRPPNRHMARGRGSERGGTGRGLGIGTARRVWRAGAECSPAKRGRHLGIAARRCNS